MNKIQIKLLPALVACSLFSSQSIAKKQENEAAPERPRYQCSTISRGEAINRAKRQTKGKVVGVQLAKQGSRPIYRVRVLIDKKRVKTITIQACR